MTNNEASQQALTTSESKQISTCRTLSYVCLACSQTSLERDLAVVNRCKMFADVDHPRDPHSGCVWLNQELFWLELCRETFHTQTTRDCEPDLVQNQGLRLQEPFCHFGLFGIKHGWSTFTTKLKGLFTYFRFFLSACNARRDLSFTRTMCGVWRCMEPESILFSFMVQGAW
jgi:ribosomal protein L37AE/L43A